MKVNKWILLCLLILSIFLSFTMGFYVGKYSNNENYYESFYANIIRNENGTLHITGIPENDINHRGEFTIAHNNIDHVYNVTSKKISIVELSVGSQIRVIYDGMVLESYPAQITHVLKIEQVE